MRSAPSAWQQTAQHKKEKQQQTSRFLPKARVLVNYSYPSTSKASKLKHCKFEISGTNKLKHYKFEISGTNLKLVALK